MLLTSVLFGLSCIFVAYVNLLLHIWLTIGLIFVGLGVYKKICTLFKS